MANEHFKRTPTSTGNRKVFTWSAWVKIGKLGDSVRLFETGTSSVTDRSILYFSGNKFQYFTEIGNIGKGSLSTDAIFRDVSSWYHVIWAFDLTKSSIKIYVNGVDQPLTPTVTIANESIYINATNTHYIGQSINLSTGYLQGELSDIFLIDGQALTPDVFGFYKDGDGYMSSGTTNATDFRPGQWVPKSPSVIKNVINNSGGFGVNGYYLPMNDSSNPGADFHCDPNSIIKLKGEDLPQPRNGAPVTSDAFVSQLRPETGTLGFDGVVKFDGAGDYLSFNGSSIDFGTGDFTVEAFVYHTGGNDDTIISDQNGFTFTYGNSGKLRFYHANGSNAVDATVNFIKHRWVHVVVVRSSNTLTFYQDGNAVGSHAYNIDIAANSTTTYIGKYFGGTIQDFAGLISNLRVIQGTALYTANFIPPSAPLTNVTNTKLLCCNSSTSATAATVTPGTITANGNAAATRNELTGSMVLAVPGIKLENTNTELVTNGTFDSDNSSWNGTGISEYHNSFTTSQSNGYLILNSNTTSGSLYGVSQNVTTVNGTRYTLSFDIVGGTGNGSIRVENGSSGSNVRTTVSGLGVGSHSFSFIAGDQSVSRVFLGRDGSTNGGTNATVHYDNVSVKEAIPVRDYSADIKGSGTNKTLTATGNAGVGYELGGYYGSAMTFDGTSDTLTTTDNISDYNFGTGDFTVETWFKKDANGSNGYDGLAQLYNTPNGSGTNGWFLEISATRGILFYSDDGTGYSLQFNGASSVNLGQWQHLAICRENNVATMFLNGVAVSVLTNFNSNITGGTTLRLGTYGSSSNFYFNGDIQDFRVYKGLAKYKGGFDVLKPYTPVGIEAFRTTDDTCKNNFATLNSLNYTSSTTALSDGNLTMKATGNNGRVSSATFNIPNSGKYYFEFYEKVIDITATNYISIDSLTDSSKFQQYRGYGYIYTDGVQATGFTTIDEGDLVGVAIDADNGTVSFYNNGTLVSTVTSSNVDYVRNSRIQSYLPRGAGSYPPGDTRVFNFGQNPSFSGNLTTGTNADDSGKGLFKYAPPTGFLALCEDNLPTPTIADPGKHFKSVLYTGDGNTGHSVTGVGFQPDLVWLKCRNVNRVHGLWDSVRGAGKYLVPSGTNIEENDTTNGIQSFDGDGFSIGSVGTFNNSTDTYVAWCWKAGGAAVSNTDGSITSQVSANQTAGFSIVSYTGTGVNATIGHGLGKRPKVVIVKRRDVLTHWTTWFDGISTNTDKVMSLDLTNAEAAFAAGFNSSNTTTTTFPVGTGGGQTNASGSGHIAYCWAEIEGFSKFGSYVGNASADGTFIYCGFKPAFVITKRTDGTSSWLIHDSSRDPVNPVMGNLYTNSSDQEGRGSVRVDFVSNGFKHRNADGGAANNYANNYIFMAFAESPFQTANAK